MFNRKNFTIKKSCGMTLIEMMISLTLGIVIISVIIEIYLASERSFHLQSALSLVQENARVSMQLLSSQLRMAGYIGCGKLTTDFPIRNTSKVLFNKNNSITEFDNNTVKRKPNTDAVTVRHASDVHVNLLKEMTNFSEFHGNRQLNHPLLPKAVLAHTSYQ